VVQLQCAVSVCAASAPGDLSLNIDLDTPPRLLAADTFFRSSQPAIVDVFIHAPMREAGDSRCHVA